MNATQTNKEHMYDATYEVLESNNAIWAGNPTMVTAVGKLNNYITGISGTATTQGVVTTGVTDNKELVREALIASIFANASAGLAYASSANNAVLKAKCKMTESSLIRAKEADLVTIGNNVHIALLPYAANLVGFGGSAATLGTLSTNTNSFGGLVSSPRSARTTPISATGTLAQQFRATTEFLVDEMDPMMEQYRTSNPDFYNAYHVARVILNIGHRTTVILMGFIYNQLHQALEHAMVTIVGNKHHKKITGVDGHYKFARLHAGTYTIQVVATGFVTQTFTITVTNPQTIHTDFTMVPHL
ncbi:MAG: carboxypeptidase regulatory-like domain-containing protein [Bacteroidia bacterium]